MSNDSLFDDLYNPNLSDTYAEEFAPAAQKQVASTSVKAYRELSDTLPERERAVLIGLRRYWASHRQAPTSYELFESMKADGCAFDLNSVRPRLTALFQHGRVAREAKRMCRVTSKTAYTWAIKEE